MIRYALVFFIISIVTGVLGFGGKAIEAAEIAKLLFYIFISLTTVTASAIFFTEKKMTD